MKLFLLLTLILGISTAHSQTIERSVIGSLGSSYSDASIDIESTLGETVITTASQSNVILTQGFHQHDDFINGIYESDIVIYTPYPNPFVNELYIDGIEGKEIQVFNLRGKLVFQGRLASSVFNAQDLESGVYFIHIEGSVLKCVKL